MGVSINTAIAEKAFKNAKTAIDNVIVNAMSRAGEEGVIYARTHGNYKDQTHNLRSSTAFVVVSNGEIKSGSGNMQPVSGTNYKTGELATGDEGQKIGVEFAESVAKEHTHGNALVVCAGMSYASHVERMGYDVLAGAEKVVEDSINKQLKEALIQ